MSSISPSQSGGALRLALAALALAIVLITVTGALSGSTRPYHTGLPTSHSL
jgi:5-enolpyruvylshikimate-3-phosphate synthase